jgi:hypothetical protein
MLRQRATSFLKSRVGVLPLLMLSNRLYFNEMPEEFDFDMDRAFDMGEVLIALYTSLKSY